MDHAHDRYHPGSHNHGSTAEGALSASGRYRRPLTWAFFITGAFMVVEFLAGYWSGSLALMSDASHMFTDMSSLGMSLIAVAFATRGATATRHTFGWYRLEVLAALANTLLIFVVGAYILTEAVTRLDGSHPVATKPMIFVALGGLGVNFFCLLLLRNGAGASLNVRGAYLEVFADAVGSLGVLVSGALIAFTGWIWVDTLTAIGIGVFILPRAYRLGRDALRILVESAPVGIDVDSLAQELEALDGVDEVHDLHVWTLTSGMDCVSVHLRVRPEVVTSAVLLATRRLLRDRHRLLHATVQVEAKNDLGCAQIRW